MILGFDPGKSGGFAIVDAKGEIVVLSRMPLIGSEWDLPGLLNIARQSIVKRVVIERIASGGRIQGPKANFTFGMGYGFLQMAAASSGKPCELVTPQRWQKDMLGKFGKGQSKSAALAAAMRIWPGAQTLILSYKKKDGVIDALLIAEWGRRNLS